MRFGRASRAAIWLGVDVVHALRIAAGHYSRLIPDETIAAEAMKLAIDLKHPIYDCFYLALAEREHAALISADKRLDRGQQAGEGN